MVTACDGCWVVHTYKFKKAVSVDSLLEWGLLVATVKSAIYIKSGSIGINVTHTQDTALPCPYN